MLMVLAGSARIPFSDSQLKSVGKPAAYWTLPDVAGKVKWCPEEDSNLHDLAIAST
jgi:hypothetical protein